MAFSFEDQLQAASSCNWANAASLVVGRTPAPSGLAPGQDSARQNGTWLCQIHCMPLAPPSRASRHFQPREPVDGCPDWTCLGREAQGPWWA